MNTQRVKLWHIGVTLALLLVFLLIVPVGAQATKQILGNGDFETGSLDPWNPMMSVGTHNVVGGYTHNGDYMLQITSDCNFPGGGTCSADLPQWNLTDLSGWPVHGDGKKYITFSAYARADDMATATLSIWFCDDATCSMGVCNGSGIHDESFFVSFDWEELSTTTELPAGTQCIMAYLEQEQSDWGMGALPVYWDDIRLYSSTPNAVTVQGFGAQSAAWPALALGTLALGAVLVFRRKRR